MQRPRGRKKHGIFKKPGHWSAGALMEMDSGGLWMTRDGFGGSREQTTQKIPD